MRRVRDDIEAPRECLCYSSTGRECGAARDDVETAGRFRGDIEAGVSAVLLVVLIK